MRKIIIIVFVLLLGIAGSAWLYFKDLNQVKNSNERVISVIPNEASLVFQYKNDLSYYEIFKDFTLFQDILGSKTIAKLNFIKSLFFQNPEIATAFKGSDLFFALLPVTNNEADLLMIAPYFKPKKAVRDELENFLISKFNLNKQQVTGINSITINNQEKFYFIQTPYLLIGSFNLELVKQSQHLLDSKRKNNAFQLDLDQQRHKNSIANLHVNFKNLTTLFNNFSKKKNPSITVGLKSFNASATLNMNYQSNAFMFNGITKLENNKQYAQLFLDQLPGTSTLKSVTPFDASSYLFYCLSDYRKFKKNLNLLLNHQKILADLKDKIQFTSSKHSINLEKEVPKLWGNEFGNIQLASGDDVGIIKIKDTNRLTFILSTISSEYSTQIRRFDDSGFLLYYFGEPFERYKRPYFGFIENHLVVANNPNAVNNFLKNYNSQKLLDRTDKNINFSQYLSNQGNIFYFAHNSNSKGILKSFLTAENLTSLNSVDFKWKEIYGLAIHFSADNDKFYTNLYMNRVPTQEDLLPNLDDELIDSLIQ